MLNDNLVAGSQILPFYLADGSSDVALIRGRMASVGTAATTIIERHEYPDLVGRLQAEALALAACLSSTLKFDGVFTLQAKGNGLVRTLFADITESGNLRGYCALDEDQSQLAALQIAQPKQMEVMNSRAIRIPEEAGKTVCFILDSIQVNSSRTTL